MLSASLLLLGSVSAATPTTTAPWFEFKDYPMKAFEKNWEGVTRFELLVAPDGAVADCRVVSSSGHEELDKTTCFLATKRAKFSPARAESGAAVWGVYRSQALWAMPDRRINAAPAPDLEVGISRLPEGALEPAAVKLAYEVDVQGNPSSCTIMPSSLKQPSVLVELGCQELLKIAPRSPVISPAGVPVPAVKTGAVLFKDES